MKYLNEITQIKTLHKKANPKLQLRKCATDTGHDGEDQHQKQQLIPTP